MGWYTVVKTIKGHRYIYQQRTWREGKKVRTESRYVGPADGADLPPNTKLPLQAKEATEPTAPRIRLKPGTVDRAFTVLTQAVLQVPWIKPWGDRPSKRKRDPVERCAAIEQCVSQLGVQVSRDFWGGAYYNSGEDRMNVPESINFKKIRSETATEVYYYTVLHELVHWTGNVHRLRRKMGMMGNEDYAREELVAEAGAVILAEYFGIATADPTRHAYYFQHWLGRSPDPAGGHRLCEATC